MSQRRKQIPGFSNYRISRSGIVESRKVVKGLETWKVLRPDVDDRGRPRVTLCLNSRARKYLVSRLVLITFIGPCPDGKEACHNNGNHSDNRLSNLRWDTHSANLLDRREHGTAVRGESINTAKLTEVDVKAIRQAGYPLQPLAKKYRVTETMVSLILRRKAWQHVT